MSGQAVEVTLSATGATEDVHGNQVDIVLSGTWVGTVALQIYANGGWVDTGDSWTANDTAVADAATPRKWRLYFTRTSGSVLCDLKGSIRV